jgi:hypothetical protein
MVLGAEGSGRLIASTESAQIGGNQPVAASQARHDRFPGQPEFGPTMEEQKGSTLPRLDSLKRSAVGLNHGVLHAALFFWYAELYTLFQ